MDLYNVDPVHNHDEPIHEAAMERSCKIVRFLLEYSKGAIVNTQILLTAVNNDYSMMAKMILRYGNIDLGWLIRDYPSDYKKLSRMLKL